MFIQKVSDFEPEKYELNSHGSSSNDERLYIDKAYNGKSFEPNNR